MTDSILPFNSLAFHSIPFPSVPDSFPFTFNRSSCLERQWRTPYYGLRFAIAGSLHKSQARCSNVRDVPHSKSICLSHRSNDWPTQSPVAELLCIRLTLPIMMKFRKTQILTSEQSLEIRTNNTSREATLCMIEECWLLTAPFVGRVLRTVLEPDETRRLIWSYGERYQCGLERSGGCSSDS